METFRGRLMAVARREGLRLRKRPGVVGLVVYGSLAGDPAELTPYSDVDIAVILNRRMPAHWTEHRLAEGVKVDLLLFHIRDLRGMAARNVGELSRSSWVDQLLLTGLMRGGEDTVLYDPTGAIRRAMRLLTRRTSLQHLAEMKARGVLVEAFRAVVRAEADLKGRRWRRARQETGNVWWSLQELVLEWAGTKRIAVAARRLRHPGIAGLAARVRALMTAGPGAVRACLEADRALHDFLQAAFYAPVEAKLRRDGVHEVEQLEFAGNYPGFWQGNRVHEFGRLKAEGKLSLRWSRDMLRQGEYTRALGLLSCFGGPGQQDRLMHGVTRALRIHGHDVSGLRRRLRRDPRYRRLAAAARKAELAAWNPGDSPASATRAVALARRFCTTTIAALDSNVGQIGGGGG